MHNNKQTKEKRSLKQEGPLAYLFGLEQFGIKLGLRNMRILTASLKSPENSYPSILVAGTNGKGSVAAMIECGLRKAGYRTGLYTSPHLTHLQERFMVNGQAIDRPTLLQEAEGIQKIIELLQTQGTLKNPPTFALSLFRRSQVDAAVFEVGLGGRFDATNVVKPIAVAVPSIDLDHEQYLGTTLAQIAFEKAGVIATNSIVVSSETKSEPSDVLRAAAAARKARYIRADKETTISYYIENGETYIRKVVTFGLTIPPSAIETALSKTEWPGRLELVSVTSNRRVLLDPAHNVASALALAEYIRGWKPGGIPFIFSALRDKNIDGILRAFGNAVSRITCTVIDSPRACALEDLLAITRSARPDLPVSASADPSDALEASWQFGQLVVVTGSVFIVGKFKGILTPIEEKPTPKPNQM
jgi:dihydrofolate synthase/folylpolyglutamate synthase